MGADNVFNVVQDRDSNHRQLAALAVNLGPVTHCLIQVEPGACQRRGMQHQAIDIDQSPASCSSDLRDELRQLWMFFFFDQGYARHRCLFLKGRLGCLCLESLSSYRKIQKKSISMTKIC